MNIDLSRFKVVYGERVLNAIALQEIGFSDKDYPVYGETSTKKPKFLSIIALNEDGNIVVINDEAWRFQFLPITKKEAT